MQQQISDVLKKAYAPVVRRLRQIFQATISSSRLRVVKVVLTGGKVRMSKDGDWSESYMVNLFDWHLKEQEQMDWLTGSAAWIFKDFATPLRPAGCPRPDMRWARSSSEKPRAEVQTNAMPATRSGAIRVSTRAT